MVAKVWRIVRAMVRQPALVGHTLSFVTTYGHRVPLGYARLALKPFRPFACAGWRPSEKLDRMRGHLQIVDTLGGIMPARRGPPRELMRLPLDGGVHRLTLDEPRAMLDDGLTVLSLWRDDRRLFSLTFLLSDEGGRHVARIGGIQGCAGEGVLELYRMLTKDAFGLRPRDLLFEAFRMLCRAIAVDRILAVADRGTYHFDPYFGDRPLAVTRLDYDAVWRDRGGRRIGDLWYELPVGVSRRSAEDVPARKRALYRRRYALLDRIENGMIAALSESGVAARPSWRVPVAAIAITAPPQRSAARRLRGPVRSSA